MRTRNAYMRPFLVSLCLVLVLMMSGVAQAALFWGAGLSDLTAGVRSKNIPVCFVGNAVTARADRVRQIVTYLREFEYATNINFTALNSNPLRTEAVANINNLACPAPTTQAGTGWDNYAGDIRVVIPNININAQVSAVPGFGCTAGDNNGWGSWSHPPWELNLPERRACLYNLKLGDDPWNATPYLNHTLHEFGHALGLAHEHQRIDANDSACIETYPQFTTQATCEAANHVWNGVCMNGYGVGANIGFMTPYDRLSMMHYMFTGCGVNGNYDYDGLSDWDKLALHIMYPEDNRIAEFVGRTVIRAGSNLALQSAWQARGANMGYVANGFDWRLNGVTMSTAPSLNVTLNTPGTYTLSLTHNDFLGRTYSYTGPVRVLATADYNKAVAALTASQTPLNTIVKEKFGVFRNGTWVLDRNGNFAWEGTPTDKVLAFGLATDKPVSGDWNGVNTADIGVFRNGTWVLDYNGDGVWNGATIDKVYSFGLATDVPVTGDWNGSGTTKIGVFRNGTWVLDYNGNGQWDGPAVDRVYSFGLSTDIPVTGDWDSDGITEIGVFRKGTWVLDYNGDGVWNGATIDKVYSFGLATDTPVTGDWDGYGRTEIGVFRNGQWILDMDGNGLWNPPADRIFSFGLSTDKTVTGEW